LVHETRVNDDEGDDKNTIGHDISADKKEAHSRDIDLLQNSIVKQLKREEYKNMDQRTRLPQFLQG
jgi:hypothetical protein